MVKSAPPARRGPRRRNQWPGNSVMSPTQTPRTEDAFDRWAGRRHCGGCETCQQRTRLRRMHTAYTRRVRRR